MGDLTNLGIGLSLNNCSFVKIYKGCKFIESGIGLIQFKTMRENIPLLTFSGGNALTLKVSIDSIEPTVKGDRLAIRGWKNDFSKNIMLS